MLRTVGDYFRTLGMRVGQGWDRFWFTPSDPYPACMLRILVGLLAGYWLFTYSFDLQAFFGPEGLLTVDGMQQLRGTRGFSYLNYVTHPAALWAVHALGLGVLAMFTAGLFTRVTSILSLVVVLSYIQRAPVLVGEFEDVLAMLMFYLCIAPCGAALSIDHCLLRRKGPASAGRAEETAEPCRSSAATVSLRLIQVHLTVIYLAMALAKLRGAVWWTGTAVWWMAARPDSRLIDLSWLSGYPDVVAAWTHAMVLFELCFPLLIWNRTARPLMLAVAAVMWLGTAALSGLLLFCLLMIVANTAFVPAAAMRGCCSGPRKAVRHEPQETEHPVAAGSL